MQIVQVQLTGHSGVFDNPDPALTLTKILKYDGTMSFSDKNFNINLYFPYRSDQFLPEELEPGSYEFRALWDDLSQGNFSYGFIMDKEDKYYVKIFVEGET